MKDYKTIRQELRSQGVEGEALVSAMMDSFERLSEEMKTEAANAASQRSAVPGWVWAVFGASILGNLVLGVMQYNGVRELQLVAAGVPKIEEVATDIKKLTAIEARFNQMVAANEAATKTLNESTQRMLQASDGLTRNAVDLTERNSDLRGLIQAAKQTQTQPQTTPSNGK